MRSLLAFLVVPAVLSAQSGDLRELYDVEAYRLDLRVDPGKRVLAGRVGVEARVTGDSLSVLELDMGRRLTPSRVVLVGRALTSKSSLTGTELRFTHEGDVLRCKLPRPLAKDTRFRVAVTYRYDRGRGAVHWARTKDGRPWVNTTCQGPGAHVWWPCKSSFFHPEDKPERLFTNLDVPAGLYGVANGRLIGREKRKRRELFRWAHPYPLETYSVTLNVAPYVVVEKKLRLDGIDGPVPFVYYVLPEHAKKAKVQFALVPEMLRVYGKAFGPFPFPKSKFALVETDFWGMEHSTAVAYGSSFPLWCRKHGRRDPWAIRNRFFDYILVHESAHEWWGNAVSARAWGHFWIHEGFGTYAESVYLELTEGRDRAERWFRTIEPMAMGRRARLFRGDGVDSRQAYTSIIYYKGAWVLNTLRHYVGDDAAWWKTLRGFNLKFRYKNATTEDFRAVLEANTHRSWKRFFDEWFYGTGVPRLTGRVKAVRPRKIVVDVRNEPAGDGGFHVPLDLAWTEGKERKSRRVVLEPGRNSLEIECGKRPRKIEVVHLDRVLGRHDVEVDS